jgi:FtsZ-binding cell division protein ZapB
MSSLLEQAIVDAQALKEAAMKNAEATIIDKYSDEVKSTLNQLLEQDELAAALGMATEAPEAEETMEEEVAKDEIVEGVPDAFTEDVAELDGVAEGEESVVTIDFAELAEALKELREGMEEETLEEAEEDTLEEAEEEPVDEELQLDEDSIMEMVAAMLSGDSAAEKEADADQMQMAGLEETEELEEEIVEEGEEDLYEELSDDLLDAIMEKLTVDMGATLSGWAGRSEESVKHQMELEMAHRRSTDVEEELEALKKAQEELVFENKKLKQNLSNYQEVVESLKENVQDVNLSNARLLYTNRTLRNTSLNERQKERIVEAISKAGSVEEAKTIHETLQSTVASTPKRGPKSLSEAITRPTSVIRASRKEEPKVDPFTTRMRKLAGIN